MEGRLECCLILLSIMSLLVRGLPTVQKETLNNGVIVPRNDYASTDADYDTIELPRFAWLNSVFAGQRGALRGIPSAARTASSGRLINPKIRLGERPVNGEKRSYGAWVWMPEGETDEQQLKQSAPVDDYGNNAGKIMRYGK